MNADELLAAFQRTVTKRDDWRGYAIASAPWSSGGVGRIALTWIDFEGNRVTRDVTRLFLEIESPQGLLYRGDLVTLVLHNDLHSFGVASRGKPYELLRTVEGAPPLVIRLNERSA